MVKKAKSFSDQFVTISALIQQSYRKQTSTIVIPKTMSATNRELVLRVDDETRANPTPLDQWRWKFPN